MVTNLRGARPGFRGVKSFCRALALSVLVGITVGCMARMPSPEPGSTQGYGNSPTHSIVAPAQMTYTPSLPPTFTPTKTQTEIPSVTPSMTQVPRAHPPNAESLQGQTLVFYGDSITIWGKNYGYSYAMYAQEYLEGISNVVIMGMGGKSSLYGLEHIDEVIAQQPDVVALEWGMNDPGGCESDAILNYNYGRYRDSTTKTIDALLAADPEMDIVIMSITPILGKLPIDISNLDGPRCDYNSYLDVIFRSQQEIATQQQAIGRHVYFNDVRADFKQAVMSNVNTPYYVDLFHPNRNGAWVMARSVLEFLGFQPPEENPYK
jgi:lysophospholipase L1-like esterase